MFEAVEFNFLEKRGITLDRSSVALCATQGFNSRVYSAHSNMGEVIVHITKPIEEQIRQRVWEKMEGVSFILLKNKELPVAKIIHSERRDDGTFLLVQQKLLGDPFGKRVLLDGDFVDEWGGPSLSVSTQIETILATLHSVSVPGFGPIVKEGKSAKGKYESWGDFLDTEFPLWLASVATKETPEFVTQLESYFATNRSSFIYDEGSLVHGDATNPSNILGSEGKVTGLIDFEWAISGDPAWEFVFNNTYPLDMYFKERSMSTDAQRVFRERISLYGPIWLTWALHVWVGVEREEATLGYEALKKKLSSKDLPKRTSKP